MALADNITHSTSSKFDVDTSYTGYNYVNLAADALVKTGAGILHTVTLSSDAAATAGTLILYDSVTEANTIIETITFVAAYLAPVTLTFDCKFNTGLYAGFTTTADVSVCITYR